MHVCIQRVAIINNFINLFDCHFYEFNLTAPWTINQRRCRWSNFISRTMQIETCNLLNNSFELCCVKCSVRFSKNHFACLKIVLQNRNRSWKNHIMTLVRNVNFVKYLSVVGGCSWEQKKLVYTVDCRSEKWKWRRCGGPRERLFLINMQSRLEMTKRWGGQWSHLEIRMIYAGIANVNK